MIYVLFENGEPVSTSQVCLAADAHVQSRWDWNSFEEVENIATRLTLVTGKTYLPVDRTDSVAPRFDIIEAPQVGDKVSSGFNGDYRPEGEIVKVTRTKVVTSTGKTFRRRKLTANWLERGGTFSMVNGHIDERNPSF